MSLPPPDPDPGPRTTTPSPASARPARRVMAVGVPAHAGRRLAERADLADPRLLAHVAGDADAAGAWLALAPFEGVAIPPSGSLGPAPAVLRVVFEVADTLRDLYLQTGSLPGEPVSDVILGPAGEVRLGTLGELSGAERPPETTQVATLLGWIARIDSPPPAVREAAARWSGARLGALCEGLEALWATHPELRGDGPAVAALAERVRDVTWIAPPALPATPAPAPSAVPPAERPRRPTVPPAAPMPPLGAAAAGPSTVAPTPSSGTLLPPRPRAEVGPGPGRRELGWLAVGVGLGVVIVALLTVGAGLAGISVLQLTRPGPAAVAPPTAPLPVAAPAPPLPPPPPAPAPAPEPAPTAAAEDPAPAPVAPTRAAPAPVRSARPRPAPVAPAPEPAPPPAPEEPWRPGRGADDLRNPFGP